MDKKTEKEVLANIYKYVRENKITTIISSQKIRDLSNVDKILVLKKGRVESIGTKDELNVNSKIYKQIKRLQDNLDS